MVKNMMCNKLFITLITLLCATILVTLVGCGPSAEEKAKQELEQAKQELEQTYEKYGTVEKESVTTSIAKYNTEIMDSGLETPAYDDGMVAENDAYWFALKEGISYSVKPVEFTGNRDNDVTDISFVYFDKKDYNEAEATKYVKYLIKANDDQLSDEQINELLEQARDGESEGKTGNIGTGISVGIYESDEDYIYQVIRLYREG